MQREKGLGRCIKNQKGVETKYSRDLEWMLPQETCFPGKIRPVHEDILLLSKLHPGQMIELEAHGPNGVRKYYAKFSPGLIPKKIDLIKHVRTEEPSWTRCIQFGPMQRG